jgi:hypothetical protein
VRPFNKGIFFQLVFLPGTVTIVPSPRNCSTDIHVNVQTVISVPQAVIAHSELGISPLSKAQYVQYRCRTGKKQELLTE